MERSYSGPLEQGFRSICRGFTALSERHPADFCMSGVVFVSDGHHIQMQRFARGVGDSFRMGPS
ncbi:MAG: hypothetical protein A2V98_05800 [Planctomycetes bacterium RBG_16_64_12]|nr:MAG: hypothetical protein A2V98_05800 [Planctomycetes bacterium RBG_16_64_12]